MRGGGNCLEFHKNDSKPSPYAGGHRPDDPGTLLGFIEAKADSNSGAERGRPQ